MIAGAYIERFTANGLVPAVRVLGDYQAGGSVVYALHESRDEGRTWLSHPGRTYDARLQVRVRGDTDPQVHDAAVAARNAVEATAGVELGWTNPVTAAEWRYLVHAVARLNGPEHVPAPPTEGVVYALNFSLLVEEL